MEAIAPAPFDFNAAKDHYYRKVYEFDRGDARCVHVSDLVGCERAVYDRIRGAAQIPFSTQSGVNFELGHAFEGCMAKVLEAGAPLQGFTYERGTIVALGINQHGDPTPVPVPPNLLALSEGEHLEAWARERRVAIGHLDFVLRKENLAIVADTKTSGKWFKKDDPPSCECCPPGTPHDYMLKTAAYAFCISAERFVPWAFSLGSKRFHEFWGYTSDYVPYIAERLARVLDLYDDDRPTPSATPQRWNEKWACSYCQNPCPKNKNPDRDSFLPS